MKITILGFGISAFWGSMHDIVLPVRLLDFVPETQKNSYLGYITFAGLVIAMVIQPIIGAISDRSRFSWGRRRPFILVGILLATLLVPGIGLWESLTIIIITYCLIQVGSNIAQTTYQGFIPDFVPDDKKGSASGIKTIVELLGGFIMVRPIAFFMDRYAPDDSSVWLWIALGSLALFLVIPMIVTLITVKEKPGTGVSLKTSFSHISTSFNINLSQNRDFIWFLFSRGLMTIPGIALKTYALYYVMDVLGVENPAGVAANLIIAVGVSLVVTTYFAGRLSDRFGRRPVLISAGFIGVLGILFIFLSSNQLQLVLSGVVIGIANGAFISTSWAQAMDLLPEGEAARYMGLANLGGAAGNGLARLIGPLIDYFNTFSLNLGYTVMLITISACFIIGSLLQFKVRREKRLYKAF